MAQRELHYERFERGGNTTAIVFIHGILGHFRDTWGEFPYLVLADSPLNHCDVICWGYPSRLRIARFPWLPLPFLGHKIPDIQGVADSLSSDLANPEIGGTYRQLVLVGHSMGGLAIMKMVISCLTEPKENSALLDRIRHIVLFATPSDGVQLPAVFKVNPQAKSIHCTGDFITELRRQWINRVYTVRADDDRQPGKRYFPFTAVVGLEDNAVSKASASAYYSDVETASGNHGEVCKPRGRNETAFQILKQSVVKSAPLGLGIEPPDAAKAVASRPAEEGSAETAKEEQNLSGFAAAQAEITKGNFHSAYSLMEKECLGFADRALGLDRLAFWIYHLYDRGWQEGFARLKQFTTDNPTVEEGFFWLGTCYREAGQFEQAIYSFEKWRDMALTAQEKLLRTSTLAKALYDAGKGNEALKELRAALQIAADPPDKAQLYEALGSLLLKMRPKDAFLAIACFEKALSLQPTNTELRFDLAFNHNQTISDALSFYHYRKCLTVKEHPDAANNAGVAAGRLNLPLTSVDHYLSAAKADHTLAMSNMARLLLDVGFEQKAQELLEAARQESEYSRQVDRVLGEIPRLRTQEEEKLTELDSKVTRLLAYRCAEADALAKEDFDISTLTGSYEDDDGKTVRISCKDDKTIDGEYLVSDMSSLTFTGTVEGTLVRVKWKSVRGSGSPIGAASLLSSLTPGTESGMGSLIIQYGGQSLKGYRLKETDPLTPYDWSLSRPIGSFSAVTPLA